jgi:hypothetical protein
VSRSTVRAAIVTYLTAKSSSGDSSISYLTNVFGFPAKYTPGREFYDGEDPGILNGAMIYLYFGSDNQRRIALGGAHSGKKYRDYVLTLDCFFRSQEQLSQTAGLNNETFLDDLVTEILADRNAGAPGTIFQWGEGGMSGGQDIFIESFYPELLQVKGAGTTTQIFSTLKVSVSEVLTT